jgi:hypothetical protein
VPRLLETLEDDAVGTGGVGALLYAFVMGGNNGGARTGFGNVEEALDEDAFGALADEVYCGPTSPSTVKSIMLPVA